jgi:hypothetical protein
VKLLDTATPEVLLEEWSREQFQEDPYRVAVVVPGHERSPHAANLWHFDTERIEDHDACRLIAERLRYMGRGDLPLSGNEDFVDVEAKTAWVASRSTTSPNRWTCEVDDDWVDPTILTRLAELLAKRKTGRRFTYVFLGCSTEAERARLRRVTRLTWDWLT